MTHLRESSTGEAMSGARDDGLDELPDLPPPAAAERIGVTISTLKTWRCRQRGPAYYRGLGKRILYRQSDLDSYVVSCRIDPRKHGAEALS